MLACVRSVYLLKFHQRNLSANCLKLFDASSQFSWNRLPGALSQTVQCSNSQYNSNPDDLKQIRKPRSIKKYFAIDSLGSTEERDEIPTQLAGDALNKVEISLHPSSEGLDASSSSEETAPWEPSSWNNVISVKYEQFDEKGSRIIYDITEEELGLDVAETSQLEPLPAPILASSTPVISLERGKTGVFDLEDLVELLRSENANDVVAMNVSDVYRGLGLFLNNVLSSDPSAHSDNDVIPAQMVWVDNMVIVSANSQRHLDALAMSVRKYYNAKVTRKDKGLIMEGRDSPWVAMDLGNIALHIMSPSERRRVDLESLWLCGPEHDLMLQEVAKASQLEEEDDLFFLAHTDPSASSSVDSEAYDITKEYSHPFIPVYEHDTLPDYSEINDDNRNTFAATSLMEMALAKHNKGYARKFRGRFRK